MPGIIELARYRKKQEKKQGYAYFCTNCESEQFRLSPSGAITCAACDRRMQNLVVTMLPKQEA